MKLNKVIPNRVLDVNLKNEMLIGVAYSSVRLMMRVKEAIYEGGYSTRAEKWFPPKLVSSRYKFIYVINPVTGTRSILKKLYKEGKSKYDTRFRRVKMADIRGRDEYRVFTTVRNPFSRLVSAWRKQVLNANTIRKIGLISQYSNIRPRMSFADFAEEVSRGAMDSHWAPQCELLREDGRDIGIDEYIRTEKIGEGYREFCKEAEVPYSELPHTASSKSLPRTGKYQHYQKYYEETDCDLIDRLERIYREDSERFGYELEY
jgi:hypothetical protein